MQRSLITYVLQCIFFLVAMFTFIFQVSLRTSPNTPKYFKYQAIEYFLSEPPALLLDDVDSLTPLYPSSFSNSLQNSFRSLQGKFIFSRRKRIRSESLSVNDVRHNMITVDVTIDSELKTLIDSLMNIITKRKRICRKLVRMGGVYCGKMREGSKMICMDEDVIPHLGCLVYSFGVGHDFSFDSKCVYYGCEVFAFDSDREHIRYKNEIMPSLNFAHIRLGTANYLEEIISLKEENETIVYRPLHSIIKLLGHSTEVLSILKIDIEDAEWDVFDKSVFKTNILQRTQQLSLEIHLEDLKQLQDNTSETLISTAKNYIRILKGLEDRGFLLTHYEPNYYAPTIIKLEDRTIHVYAETLWLNPNFTMHINESYIGDFYADYEYPPEHITKWKKKLSENNTI